MTAKNLPVGRSLRIQSMVALLLAGLPYNLGLIVAAVAALAAGAEVERRLYPGGNR